MDDYDFEYLVAELWRKKGYETQVSQQSRDGAIDVTATKQSERLAIQAKRYARGNTVGVRTVREMASLHNRDDVDRVAIATSASYSKPAYKEAHRSDIELYDGEDLVRISNATPSKAANFNSSFASVLPRTNDPIEFVGYMLKLVILLAAAIYFGYVLLDMFVLKDPVPGYPAVTVTLLSIHSTVTVHDV